MMTLDEHQEYALNDILASFNNNENFVVKGCAGTGKSLLAIMLFMELIQESTHKTLMLMYNKPLCQYTQQEIFKKILKNDEENFNLFFDAIEEYFKNKDEYKIQTIYSYTRHKLDDENYFKNHYKSKRWNTIIIDEGQDFPLRVLEWLKHQADRIICFIDDGQSSAEPNSGYPDFVEEVTELLGADLPYDLEQNHRNTQAIIDLAKEFSYKKEDSPSITGQGEKPYWHRVARENEQTLLERIFKENPNKTIGIFCPKKPKNVFMTISFRNIIYKFMNLTIIRPEHLRHR